jgi:2-dehydro-3-deoxy-D-arabinonate dehydratase
MTCTVTRAGKTLFEGAVNIAKLHRRLETLVEFLTRANPVPAGTVLLTGTGIIVPQSCALAPGDIVRIAIPEIGELANPVEVVG